MPAEQQIEAITKKLMELNPGFDGMVSEYKRNLPPKFVGGVVSEYGFNATNMTGLSQVRTLTGLKVLCCSTAPRPAPRPANRSFAADRNSQLSDRIGRSDETVKHCVVDLGPEYYSGDGSLLFVCRGGCSGALVWGIVKSNQSRSLS